MWLCHAILMFYKHAQAGWPLRIFIEIQGFQGFFKVFFSQIQGFLTNKIRIFHENSSAQNQKIHKIVVNFLKIMNFYCTRSEHTRSQIFPLNSRFSRLFFYILIKFKVFQGIQG